MKKRVSLIKVTFLIVIIGLLINFLLVSTAIAGNASITMSKPGMAVYRWEAFSKNAVKYLSNGAIRIGDGTTDTIIPIYRFEIPKVGTISNINVTIHVTEYGSLSGGTEVYIGTDSQGNISKGDLYYTYAPDNSAEISVWIDGESDNNILADYIDIKFVNSGYDDIVIHSIDVYIEYGTIPDTQTNLIAQFQQIYDIYTVLDGYDTYVGPILNDLAGHNADQIFFDGISKAYSVVDALSKLNGFDVSGLDAASWGSWILLIKDITTSLNSAWNLWEAVKELINCLNTAAEKLFVIIDLSDSDSELAAAVGPAASAVKTLAITWQQAILNGDIDEIEQSNIISNIDTATRETGETGKMVTLKNKLEVYAADVFDGGPNSEGWSDPKEIGARKCFLQLTQPLKVYSVINNVATESEYLLKDYIDLLNEIKASFPRLLTVTASAGSNGSITPSGNISMKAGSDKKFYANPNYGYVVDKWLLDGNLVQYGGSNYTIVNIQSNHTLTVSFKPSVSGTGENNNSWDTAGYLGVIDGYRQYDYDIGLSITSGDVDYYKFTLVSTCTADDYIEIVLKSPSTGEGSSDIDLALGKVNNVGKFVSAHGKWHESMSRSETRTETVSLNGRGPGDYYVIVFGASGFDIDTEDSAVNPNFAGSETSDYRLIINAPDSYEDDDTPEQAKSISTDGAAQRHSLSGSDDPDWVMFTLTQDSDVVVQLSAGTFYEMDMVLYGPDSSSTFIADSEKGGNSESCVISRIGSNYLLPGTYYLKVGSWLVNDIPQYSLSVFAGVATVPPPPPPTIDYPSSSTSGQYTVSWSSSSRAIAYQLERSRNGGGIWSLVYSGPDTSYPESISNVGNYRYRVKATNASGTSNWTIGTWDCVVYPNPDLNADGIVNFKDFALFAIHWDESNWTGPENLDWVGNVDFGDLQCLASKWLSQYSYFKLSTIIVEGWGTVTPSNGTYEPNTVVTLTAQPAPGFSLEAWSGTNDDSSTANTNTVTMDSDKTVRLMFERALSLLFDGMVVRDGVHLDIHPGEMSVIGIMLSSLSSCRAYELKFTLIGYPPLSGFFAWDQVCFPAMPGSVIYGEPDFVVVSGGNPSGEQIWGPAVLVNWLQVYWTRSGLFPWVILRVETDGDTVINDTYVPPGFDICEVWFVVQ